MKYTAFILTPGCVGVFIPFKSYKDEKDVEAAIQALFPQANYVAITAKEDDE